jgi:hypothetical protein
VWQERLVNVRDNERLIELGSTGAERMKRIHFRDVLERFSNLRLGCSVAVDDTAALVALKILKV